MTDQADDPTWSIQLTAAFEVIDTAQIADSAEGLICEDNPERIFRLDTLWIEDDPMERGDAFVSNDDNLHDAQDPTESLWVAFKMLTPSWAGLEGWCDVTTSVVGSNPTRVKVHVEAQEVSIADLPALDTWIGRPADSDDWVETHIARFITDIHETNLIDLEVESTLDYEPNADS